MSSDLIVQRGYCRLLRIIDGNGSLVCLRCRWLGIPLFLSPNWPPHLRDDVKQNIRCFMSTGIHTGRRSSRVPQQYSRTCSTHSYSHPCTVFVNGPQDNNHHLTPLKIQTLITSNRCVSGATGSRYVQSWAEKKKKLFTNSASYISHNPSICIILSDPPSLVNTYVLQSPCPRFETQGS